MKKKMKLENLAVSSFVTIEDGDTVVGGLNTNQRACPTAYACPTEWPVCIPHTHPFVC